MAKAIQERLTEPFYWLAADTIINMLPEKYNNANKPGALPVCEKAISMTHHTIKFFADMGINVVVEYINGIYDKHRVIFFRINSVAPLF